MNQNSFLNLTMPLWNTALRGGLIGFGACAVGVGFVHPVGWALLLLPASWWAVAHVVSLPLFDPEEG